MDATDDSTSSYRMDIELEHVHQIEIDLHLPRKRSLDRRRENLGAPEEVLDYPSAETRSSCVILG
jgi:hypothetical protein